MTIAKASSFDHRARRRLGVGRDWATRVRTRVWLAIGLVWVLGLARDAAAATPAEVVDTSLRVSRVQIQSLGGGVLSYFNADRELQAQPLDRFVLIRDIGGQRSGAVAAEAHDPSLGMVQMVDGQRLVGRWAGVQDDGQVIRWRHQTLGEVGVSLERIRWVTLSGAALGDEPASRDQVILNNGDTVDGYVLAVDEAGWSVQLADQRTGMTLPTDRVRAVRLANPPDTVGRDQPGSHWVWLADGSRVAVRALAMTGDQVTLTLAWPGESREVVVAMPRIDRIVPASSSGYLVQLADLPMRVIEGGSVFGLTVRPRVMGRSIWMHAPVAVQFDLPPGAQALRAVIQLVMPAGGGDSLYGADCEARWRLDDQPVAGRFSLSPAQATTTVHVSFDGESTLTLDLDEASNGPILDRVLIQDGMVYVRSTNTP